MTISQHLTSLYSATTARELTPRVRALMEQTSAQLTSQAPRASRTIDERDVLLITYGDQMRANDEPPLQTLTAFLNLHLRELFSGVHILPFFPSSSDDGFSVVDYYTVDPKLGAWNNLDDLGQHFDLMFDAVINHTSAQSEWFQKFLRGDPAYRNYFITVNGHPDLSRVVRPRALPLLTRFETAAGPKNVWTTFSADQIDLNYANPDVLLQMLDVVLFYVTRGARFIRLDAVAYLWKEIGTTCIHLPQTHALVQLLRAILDEIAPGVMLITETNVPHIDNVSYFGDGTNEAQLVYNFALPPLVLHTFLSGDATALTHWAQSLDLPSDRVTFFNFLASHDGIGLNPARGILRVEEIDALVNRAGERGALISYKNNAGGSTAPYEINATYFDALANPPAKRETTATAVNRFMCAHAIMLALRGVPGIYFHSLFGSRNDHAGASASGMPRRINRQKFTRDELERDLSERESIRAQVFARFSELLRVRRGTDAFHPNGAQRVLDVGPDVFAFVRSRSAVQGPVLCLHSATDKGVTFKWGEAGPATEWQDLISGEKYSADSAGSLTIRLQPYQVAWLQCLVPWAFRN